MPINGSKVNIYSCSKHAYQQHIASDDIDDNGVYFVNGGSLRQIYVGTTIYSSSGSGDSSTAASIKHFVYHRYGTISSDEDITCELEDLISLYKDTLCITGVFLNGLRTVSEINAHIAYSIQYDEDNIFHVPTLIIHANHDYLDQETELTIDILAMSQDIGGVTVYPEETYEDQL